MQFKFNYEHVYTNGLHIKFNLLKQTQNKYAKSNLLCQDQPFHSISYLGPSCVDYLNSDYVQGDYKIWSETNAYSSENN